jgi:hypothetical protein
MKATEDDEFDVERWVNEGGSAMGSGRRHVAADRNTQRRRSGRTAGPCAGRRGGSVATSSVGDASGDRGGLFDECQAHTADERTRPHRVGGCR